LPSSAGVSSAPSVPASQGVSEPPTSWSRDAEYWHSLMNMHKNKSSSPVLFDEPYGGGD
ncbi:unnamed protein product, partial [Amoebophrya sp. A25]